MTLVTHVGKHLDVLIMFVVTVCCSGIKLYMKCVDLVYTDISMNGEVEVLKVG